MRSKIALCFIMVTMAASPAWADKLFAVTPSGAAEMLFSDSAQATVSTLSSKCIDASWTVISSGPTEVICEARLNMGQSVLGQALLGNSYSTPPRRFFRFNIAEINGFSRVQASGWMELQMAFGQIRRTDFAGPEFQNSIFNFMGAAGGQFPVGTTFPNHVVLGFRPADVPLGAYRGMRITELGEGSAAAKAGLKVGDVVTAIGGKRFKNQDDYLDATAQAAERPTYVVEFLREGQKMTATLERQFRPAISQMIAAKAATHSAPTAMLNNSVADELAKLAKLHETGILTDTEFEAQKHKLLAQ